MKRRNTNWCRPKRILRQAELEARRNPLLAAITARQNTLGRGSCSRQAAPVGARHSQSPGQRNSRHRDSGSGAEQSQSAGRNCAAQHRIHDAESASRRIRQHPAEYGLRIFHGRDEFAQPSGRRYGPARNGRGADSGSIQLGSQRANRRAGSRTFGGGTESRHHRNRRSRKQIRRAHQRHRRHRRTALEPPLRLQDFHRQPIRRTAARHDARE